MANMINALETLKKDGAVRVYPGMIAVWPQFNQEEALNLMELAPKFNGRYATNNSTACFVHENEVFVTPYTRAVIATLRSFGFTDDYFYVPFSNGDYPKQEESKWKYLRHQAEVAYQEEFTADCYAYCDKHGYGTISDETLANCFEMPATGVAVKHLYFEDTYYPAISRCLDCVAIDRIGRFCTNNGRVVFVYRNGKTYVAKGYKILSELRSAGYKESGLFVPFSNGEAIQDPVLKARWDAISK